MYDVIIIGSGPAGFTAAIYASRREMKTLIVGREPGGQMIWASEIENYLGFPSIKNYDLIEKMKDHVEKNNVEIKNAEVVEIKKEDKIFKISTKNEIIEAKTVIIASGLVPRKLNAEGEDDFMGRGVTYCANCDGPFYRGKTIAVVGGGNSALDAAEVLSKIAKKVYLIHRNQKFKAFEVLVKEVENKKNIELVLDFEVLKIKGAEKLESIDLKNINSGEIKNIVLDGLFIEIGRVAKTDIFKDLVERDGINQIVVDEYCRTKTEGLFAAGDVTNIPYKQISIASGQATIAALSAYQFLQIGDIK